MSKYLMNKDVIHDGEIYKKGSELKPSAKGFKTLVQSGHAVVMAGVGEQPVEVKPEAKPEEPAKPFRKSRQ